MALWGNSDNLSVSGVSAGATVRLDYSTGTVTGSGTTFGRPGAGQTGDVIRFGTRHTGTYFGDAVIVSIASTTSLTIGSTEGLSGASIASTVFTVSELPEYTILDSSYSENTLYNRESPQMNFLVKGDAYAAAGAGSSNVAVYVGTQLIGSSEISVSPPLKVGDFIVNDGNNLVVNRVGGAVTAAGAGAASTTLIYCTPPPGLKVNDYYLDGGSLTLKHKVVSTAATTVTLSDSITTAIASGGPIIFEGDHMIGLQNVITSAISSGDQLTFRRLHAGYDKYCYGVADAGTEAAIDTVNQVTHAGWVGVTTYVDGEGNYRVKSETLVAMSGIITASGNNQEFPPIQS